MPTAAATMEEAITLAEENISDHSLSPLFDLQSTLNDFANAAADSLAAILDDTDISQRTVSDWRVLITEQSVRASPDGSATLSGVQTPATIVIQKTLRAAINAENQGRITTAQETAILAAYNVHLGS